ncbi:MAG: hypothetical protein V8R80_07095 [Eubacterium sp.]
MVKAAIRIIDGMKVFYQNLGLQVQEILEFEYEKFVDAGKRYAWMIRDSSGTVL